MVKIGACGYRVSVGAKVSCHTHSGISRPTVSRTSLMSYVLNADSCRRADASVTESQASEQEAGGVMGRG